MLRYFWSQWQEDIGKGDQNSYHNNQNQPPFVLSKLLISLGSQRKCLESWYRYANKNRRVLSSVINLNTSWDQLRKFLYFFGTITILAIVCWLTGCDQEVFYTPFPSNFMLSWVFGKMAKSPFNKGTFSGTGKSTQYPTQLSNLWWMPNSVSKGFDTAMKMGSSRRF